MSGSQSAQVDVLREIARLAMLERGLEPDFPEDALRQAAAIAGPARPATGRVRDLRELPWASIDNDDSRDLDQLTVAERLAGGAVRVLIAIADVDALVPPPPQRLRHPVLHTDLLGDVLRARHGLGHLPLTL